MSRLALAALFVVGCAVPRTLMVPADDPELETAVMLGIGMLEADIGCTLVSKIVTDRGKRTDWLPPRGVVRIRKKSLPGDLAGRTRYVGGRAIIVFEESEPTPALVAHEYLHVLRRSKRHAETGLMASPPVWRIDDEDRERFRSFCLED